MNQDAEFDAPDEAPKPKPRPTAARPAQKPATEPAQVVETAPKSELQILLEHEPGKVLLSEEHRAALLSEIRLEMQKFKPDLSTVKGRDAIKSHAFKITKTKTALDDAGKALNANLREQINKVDAIRRSAWDDLEGMAIEARKPLTDWEAAETMREEKARKILGLIAEAMKAFPGETAAELEERLAAVRAVAIDASTFVDDTDAATEKRDEAISHLAFLLNAAQEREAMAAENERLRQRDAERQAELDRLAQVERDAQAAQEAAAAAKARKAEDEANASQRAAEAAEQAAEAAREEERQIAAAAAAEIQRQHEAELARVQQQAAADLLAQQQADAARKAAEQTEAQRRAIRTSVRNSLVALGLDKEKAGEITLAILDGKVPHISIDYETEN